MTMFAHQLYFLRCRRTRSQHGRMGLRVDGILTPSGTQLRIRIHVLQRGGLAKDRLKRQTNPAIHGRITLIIILSRSIA